MTFVLCVVLLVFFLVIAIAALGCIERIVYWNEPEEWLLFKKKNRKGRK